MRTDLLLVQCSTYCSHTMAVEYSDGSHCSFCQVDRPLPKLKINRAPHAANENGIASSYTIL